MSNPTVSITPVEKKGIEQVLTQKKDEAKLITKIQQINEKKKKNEDRILILGTNRIYLFTDKGKIAEEYHYLDLSDVQSSSENEIVIRLKNQTIFKMIISDAGLILKALYSQLMSTFPGIKIGKSLSFSISPETRMVSIFQSTSFKDITGCGSFANTYKSVCDFLGVQPLQSVLWDVEYLYPVNGVREFNLTEVYQYGTNDLKALLMSLSFNTYFTSFNANGMKLSSEEMTQLTEVFQVNTSIQQLSLVGNQVSKESIITLLTSIAENKALHLNYINLNNNVLENKGITALGASLQTFTAPLFYINIENTSAGAKGLEAMFTCLVSSAQICSNLQTLIISNNKLEAPGTVALCKFLSKATALQTLNMSNTSPVFSQLKSSSSSLNNLDFSGNRPSTTKEGVIDLLSFFKQMPHLQSINLSRTYISTDDLKLLFSPATNLNKVASVDLSENELGDAGVLKLCEIMYPNSNLRHLAIDGNFKTKSKLRMRTIDAIVNLIEDNNGVESLSIAAGNSKHQLKNDVVPLILSLIKNQSLTKLDISGNGMGDSGALALCKVLWKNETLKTLKLDGNDFSITGLKMIKNAIKRNPKSVTLLPLPISDIYNVLKSDNATINQEKVQKTLIELQYSVINNYKTQSSGQQEVVLAPVTFKPSPPRKMTVSGSSPSTSNSSNTSASSKIGFGTLPIKRPAKGPLYPGRSTISTALGQDKSNNAGTGPEIPSIVSRSIDLLIERGIKSVGIFRTCASATQLKKIKARFETGEDIDLKNEGIDVDTVAGVLKSYFRELVMPIFPEVLHESFFQASRQPTVDDKIKLLKEIIDHLAPLENKMVKKLFLLLHLISLEREENMMSPENIAICWAPTLFRSFASELLPINAFLIVNYYDIFDPEAKPKSPESQNESGSNSVENGEGTGSTPNTILSPNAVISPKSPKSPLRNSTGVTNTISANNSRKSSGFTNTPLSTSSNSSSSNSPTSSPPSSPKIDGSQTLRSKRFSRVSRISYSPILPRAWSNESRTVSSLFQDELDIDPENNNNNISN